MTQSVGDLLAWAPAFALVLGRIGAAMALLPALGEHTVPAMIRAGLALAIAALLAPVLAPGFPPLPDSGLAMALMVAGEVVTGLWFAWLTRLIAVALPMGAQFVASMVGLSSVLQPDPDLGPQSTALAKLFDIAVPVIILSSGLYTIVLEALVGLFRLIPPGHMLPAGDSAQVFVLSVGKVFALALQVASPFVLAAMAWHVAMGQVARVMSRVQIFFVVMPGQILGGLALLAVIAGVMITAWQNGAGDYFATLPGRG
ncbi:MAG: flagellar biosynthetic protein FliR [Acetobacteraceae bacterium]|nr:flagellar biosynthetic protein FliR [Pseudomonadota bacterium]